MNKSFQRRLDKVAQGIAGLPPRAYTVAENRAWAEAQLAEMMQEHSLSRAEAPAYAQEHAPMLFEMLIQRSADECIQH
jgi:hypothetical protein